MAIWESLVLTALGGGIGVAGAVAGARMQANDARRSRQEQYEREDRFRLHQERIAAYSRFYVIVGQLRASLGTDPQGQAALDKRAELWHAYTGVLLLGSEAVLKIAVEVVLQADNVVWRGAPLDRDAWRQLIRRLQLALRTDLIGTPLDDGSQEIPAWFA